MYCAWYSGQDGISAIYYKYEAARGIAPGSYLILWRNFL